MRIRDDELVPRALAGDESAFAELVGRYRDAVRAVAFHYLGNLDDVQDAAQEAFIQAYLRLRQLREPAKLGPWLRRITENVCADMLRRRDGRLLPLDAADEQTAASTGHNDPRSVAVRFVVCEALKRLSEKLRLTVTLACIDGYSHAEIAEILEVPLNTVRRRLQHAKKQLREEMVTMVTNTLSGNIPDADFARQVIEEAVNRGDKALESHARAAAVRHYDDALNALETLGPASGERRLRMELLQKKGIASKWPPFEKDQSELYREALEIARELGDRRIEADLLGKLGDIQGSLAIYRELCDLESQGVCLRVLGHGLLLEHNVTEGRRCYQEALALFEAVKAYEGIVLCRAVLGLIDEVGEEAFPRLLLWEGGCDGIKRQSGALIHLLDHWNSGGKLPDTVPDPWPFATVFSQITHLSRFLDAGVPVGGSWSGETDTYSFQPLRATVTVLSNSEKIAVPAGTFEPCLLVEYLTTESGLADNAPEESERYNRMEYLGRRLALYAPGVGLVQLRVERADGTEAFTQLKEFSVRTGSRDYLPLSVGHWWSYARPGVSEEYTARQVYRVSAHGGDAWFIERRIWWDRRDVSDK